MAGQPNFSADVAVSGVMHAGAKRVHPDQLVVEAARVMRENQIDQVPVVDDSQKPVGLLDVQDLQLSRADHDEVAVLGLS